MKRQGLTIGIVSSGVILAGWWLVQRGGGESVVPVAQAQGPGPVVEVQTVRPEYRDIFRVIRLPGDVTPIEEATLYAKTAGYLDRIMVDKGDRVQAGQLIATLRAPELEADKEQAKDAYRSALESAGASDAAVHKAESEKRRAQASAGKAEADYLQAPIGVAKAKAQLVQAQTGVQRAQEQKNQADAAMDESRAQVNRAQADLEAAQAEQQIAETTYQRYRGIYDRDNKLIARQDVDVAESRMRASRGHTASATAQLESAKIHVRSVEAQSKAAQHQVEEARAGVAVAAEQVKMSEAQTSSMSKQVDVARRDVDVSEGQKQTLTRQRRQAEYSAAAQGRSASRLATLADYAQIRSPFTGIVTKRSVDSGAFIQTAAGSQSAQPIVTVANMDTVRVYFHVPETEARFVKAGTPVEIAWGGPKTEPVKAKVSRTSGTLDPKSRTLLAEADQPNRDRKLIPGAFVMAKLGLEEHKRTLSLPSAAIIAEKQNRFVFIVEKGKAKRLPIVLGFEDGKRAEVLDGLKGGEEVVVTGRDALAPGASVKTSPWTPPSK